MITCGLEQLLKQREDELRMWLNMPQLGLLQKVAKAQAQKHICVALKDATHGGTADWKLDGANASMKRAQRYSTFLEVLQEIIEQKDPYETAKLS